MVDLSIICKHCGCTYGSHNAGNLFYPIDYCPYTEGKADWAANIAKTTFSPSNIRLCDITLHKIETYTGILQKIEEENKGRAKKKEDFNIIHPTIETYKKESSPFDTQVGGSHYKDFKIEPFEFFFKNNIPHHKATVIRRILRYDHTTGDGLEDLEKIKHEVDLIIELEGYK